MRIIIIITMCILSLSLFGQFGVIEDNDGYVNIRNSSKSIIDTLTSGEIIYCFESEGDWLPVDYELGRQNKSGFIHKSRIKLVKHFENIDFNGMTDSSITFVDESFSIRFTKIVFDQDANELQYQKINSLQDSPSYLKWINGNQIWGTDGGIPKTQYGEVSLKIDSTIINLPIDNLFEPNLRNTFVYYDRKDNIIYVTALNSDGAGGYAVLWVVKNGAIKERITTIPF